jgi:hypothetical protein
MKSKLPKDLARSLKQTRTTARSLANSSQVLDEIDKTRALMTCRDQDQRELDGLLKALTMVPPGHPKRAAIIRRAEFLQSDFRVRYVHAKVHLKFFLLAIWRDVFGLLLVQLHVLLILLINILFFSAGIFLLCYWLLG